MLFGFPQDKDQTMSSEVVGLGFLHRIGFDSDGFRNWFGGFSSGIVSPSWVGHPGLSGGIGSAGNWI